VQQTDFLYQAVMWRVQVVLLCAVLLSGHLSQSAAKHDWFLRGVSDVLLSFFAKP
jgi:hypothetical protein